MASWCARRLGSATPMLPSSPHASVVPCGALPRQVPPHPQAGPHQLRSAGTAVPPGASYSQGCTQIMNGNALRL